MEEKESDIKYLNRQVNILHFAVTVLFVLNALLSIVLAYVTWKGL